MSTNELPSSTYVAHRMCTRISWRLLPPSNRSYSVHTDGYNPLLRALDFYTKQEWIIHVFPWVVGIRGLLHPSHICALLQFLEVPHKHWLSAVEGTVLASVNPFYFLHRVRFGGHPAGCLLGTGLDQADLGEDPSDLDASRMIRSCCKRRSSRGHDGGTISQRDLSE